MKCRFPIEQFWSVIIKLTLENSTTVSPNYVVRCELQKQEAVNEIILKEALQMSNYNTTFNNVRENM